MYSFLNLIHNKKIKTTAKHRKFSFFICSSQFSLFLVDDSNFFNGLFGGCAKNMSSLFQLSSLWNWNFPIKIYSKLSKIKTLNFHQNFRKSPSSVIQHEKKTFETEWNGKIDYDNKCLAIYNEIKFRNFIFLYLFYTKIAKFQ